MKSYPLQIFLVVICMSFLTQASAHAQTYASVHEVKAAEYCDFLNQNATSDPHHLFDDAMATGPESACILRLGTPGDYSYEVIAGREHFPVMYVNDVAQQKYCDWLQHGVFVNEPVAGDPYLKSNQVGFQIAGLPSSQLLMFGPEVATVGTAEEGMHMEVIEALGIVVVGALLDHGEHDQIPEIGTPSSEGHRLTASDDFDTIGENPMVPVHQPGENGNSTFCRIFSSAKGQYSTEGASHSGERVHLMQISHDTSRSPSPITDEEGWIESKDSNDYCYFDGTRLTFGPEGSGSSTIVEAVEVAEAKHELAHVTTSSHQLTEPTISQVEPPPSRYRLSNDGKTWEKSNPQGKWEATDEIDTSSNLKDWKEVGYDGFSYLPEQVVDAFSKNYNRLECIDKKTGEYNTKTGEYNTKIEGYNTKTGEYKQELEKLPADCDPDKRSRLENGLAIIRKASDYDKNVHNRFEREKLSVDPRLRKASLSVMLHRIEKTAENPFEKLAKQLKKDYDRLAVYKDKLIGLELLLAAQPDHANNLRQVEHLTNAITAQRALITTRTEHAELLSSDPSEPITPESQAKIEKNKWSSVNHDSLAQYSDLFQQAADAMSTWQRLKADNLYRAAMSLEFAAEEAQKPIPNQEAISLFTRVADLYQKAVNEEDAGQKQKAANLTQAAMHLWKAAEALKAAAMEVKASTPNQEAISLFTQSSDLHQKAAAALSTGQQRKAENLNAAASNLEKAALETQKPTPNQEAISRYIQDANHFNHAEGAREEDSCTVM